MEDAEDRRQDKRRQDKWHVGKEIPLSVIGAFIANIVVIIWVFATFAANQESNNKILLLKIDDLAYQVAALTADKYTQGDAMRDQALMNEKIENLRRQVEDLKWRKK